MSSTSFDREKLQILEWLRQRLSSDTYRQVTIELDAVSAKKSDADAKQSEQRQFETTRAGGWLLT